jgi:hypothetical protein
VVTRAAGEVQFPLHSGRNRLRVVAFPRGDVTVE